MRLHLSENDRYQGRPLYEAIIEKRREMKIAGTTAFRGLEGYGGTAEIHRRHLLGHDLPIVIHVVDSAENIERLSATLEEMMGTGLIAVSDVQVTRLQKKQAIQHV